MKCVAISALCIVAAVADGDAEAVPGPIGKVLTMIGDLEQKILAEGDTTQKSYEEYAEFCEDRNKELGFEVKTGKSNVEDLTSTIQKASADIEELTAKIDDLAAQSSTNSKELKQATAQRKKEAASFAKVEKDLVDTVDTLSRASGIIEKEMKGGASFAQLTGLNGLMSALDTLVKAQSIGTADGAKLGALLQSYSSNDDAEESASAPDAAAYESKSGGILDALADLQSKAEDELSESRKAESKAQNNFDLKKQALTDELKFAAKDLDEAKKTRSATEEKKAGAEGDLTSTSKDLAEDEKVRAQLHADCMSRAGDFEAETTARGEELKALATAKKIIKEATSLAQVTDQASFLQVSSSSRTMNAVHMVRELAHAQRSKSLARLASRMESAAKGGANPFAKVMGMIGDMIAKLEKEAEEEAAQKAFCDKSLGEANAKKDEATTAIDKLTVKMEQNNAKSTKLKEEVTVLQAELAKLMAAQQEMDKLRAEENSVFVESNAELTKGLAGIQLALKTLRDYYAANDSSNSGAGGGIISLLEVCESDISKELAEITATEEDAAAQYKAETQENELVKMTKDKDVEFKNKEIASLKKTLTEHDTDLKAVQEELDAVMASLASLEKQCIGKAESYGEKVAKQKAEIDGLKSALTSLGGASLLQVSKHSSLRGA
jgi:chromosome segregation ATPase